MGFIESGTGQLACNFVSTVDRALPLLTGQSCDREVVPKICLHVVLRDALTEVVHLPEVELRSGVSLFNRQPILAHCFDEILRDAAAGGVT